MMRNKFLRILLATTASLTMSAGLWAVGASQTIKDAGANPAATSVVFGKVAKGTDATYLGATQKSTDANDKQQTYALTKVVPNADFSVLTPTPLAPKQITKVNTAAIAPAADNSPFYDNTISNLTLFNNMPLVNVPVSAAAHVGTIIGDYAKNIFLVTKTVDGTEVFHSANTMRDGNAAPVAVDGAAVALAAGTSVGTNTKGTNFAFAAVPGAGKTWSVPFGTDDNRGIAVLTQAADKLQAMKKNDVTAPTAAAPGAVNEGAHQIKCAVNADKAPFAGAAFAAPTQPLAIKWGVAPSIGGAELTEGVNMYWNSDINRLYVGLAGVKRDDPAKEGGVCSLLVGDVDNITKNAFVLQPAVKSMTAPRSDVENANKKVAVANAACIVAEALATASATSLQNAQYVAIAARAAAAVAGKTKSYVVADVVANSADIEKAVAQAFADEAGNKQGLTAGGVGAGAAVAGVVAASIYASPIATGAGEAAAAGGAADAEVQLPAGVINTTFAAGNAGAVAVGGAGIGAVLGALGDAQRVAGLLAISHAVVAGINHATAGGIIGVGAAIVASTDAAVTAVLAQGGKADIVAATAATLTALAIYANSPTAAVAANTNAAVATAQNFATVVGSLGVAMAKAINADAITGVDAMMAVNAVIAAFDANTGTLAAKVADARTAAQVYVEKIGYSDVALAMKKVKDIAAVPVVAAQAGADIAATSAASLVEVVAGACRAGLANVAANNGKATEYVTALQKSALYDATKAKALDYLNAAIAFQGAVGVLKGPAAAYDDNKKGATLGFVHTQDLAHAKNTAWAVSQYCYDDAVGGNSIYEKADNAILNPLVKSVYAVDKQGCDPGTAVALQATAAPYLNQKVAANNSNLMVTNYFAPVDAAGYACTKDVTLDAGAVNNDAVGGTGRARIVHPFPRNGSDDVAITAGKMYSFKTAGTNGKNYLITNIITSAPAQMAGGLFISGSKNLICALPVLSEKKADGTTYHAAPGVVGTAATAAPFVGTIAKVVDHVANFDYPASTMAELPSMNDAAVVVGGGKALFGGTWVKDIFTDANNNVYVALGGYKPANEGLWKSTAFVDATTGAITGWTPWVRVKGLNKRIIAAAYDSTTGRYMFLRAQKDAGIADTTDATELAKFYTNVNTVEVTGGTTAVIEPATAPIDSLTKIVARQITPETGGVFNVFNYNESTSGFAEGQMSMLVSVGFDKLTLAKTGKWDAGTLTPETTFNATAGATQNVFTNNDPDLAALAPLVCTAIVPDATGQAWLFAGGSKGLAVYRLIADGSGLKNFTGKTYETAAGVTTVFNSNLWTFKKIGGDKFNGVRKLLAKGNALWVVTETMIYAIGVAANKFIDAAPAPLNETVVMQFDPDTMGYLSDVLVLDNNVVVAATTTGMYVFKYDTTTLAWAVDNQYATLGPVTQVNYVQKTAGKGELVALFANFANKTGELRSYAVDTTKTTLSEVVTSLNKTINLSGFYLNFATDGAVAVVNSPTDMTVKVVQLGKTDAAQQVIEQDFSKGGAPALDSTSGRFVIPGDEGLVVN